MINKIQSKAQLGFAEAPLPKEREMGETKTRWRVTIYQFVRGKNNKRRLGFLLAGFSAKNVRNRVGVLTMLHRQRHHFLVQSFHKLINEIDCIKKLPHF